MLFIVLLCFLSALCVSVVSAEDAAKDQVRCYTTWDNLYFYLAFRADCPDVQATHSAPNADISGDDSVEFYIETDNGRAAGITPACFSMGVSAAGGSIFRAGNAQGQLEPVKAYTFRYGATVQGTINNSDDLDMGYSIEMAIPWQLMNANSPGLGGMMNFNVVIRRHGKAGDFVSLSPAVKTEKDILDPSKWTSLVFAAHSFGAATTSREKIVSAKPIVRVPLIDGMVGDKEWNRNTSFALDMPVPPGFVYEAKYPLQRLVFTHYFYWYQADQRKTAPYSHIVSPDGVCQLGSFPAKNAGPWFSYDRVQWHKDELSDMVGAGIDVVLPVYWGDKASRAGFARKGLDCMVAALRELRAEGKPYPLVGMFFDTTAMQVAYGQKPDLKQDEVKRAFYGMIKDFFERIPPEFRAVAQADKPRAGQAGCIVFLYTGAFFSDFDSGFVQYCNERFERDFGRALVWVASDDFKDKAKGIDGFANYGAGLGPGYDGSGRIRVGTVGAGFDDSAVAGPRKARIRSRDGGDVYRNDWAEMLRKNPQWIVCDGWNEFHEGSDLCASRQYGRKYIETTRASVKKFLGGRDYDVRFLRWNVPKIIPPKQFVLAELVIRNNGSLPWKTSEGYALAYRWYKGGRFYGESKVRRPLEKDVLPGETVMLNIGVAAVSAQGTEIPEGNCEIRFELIRLSDNKWFSALGDDPLMVPTSVGRPADWDATYLSSNIPVMVAGGHRYTASVRVRNDGVQVWKKGVTRLGCKLYKVAGYTHDNPDDVLEEVPVAALRAVLDKDCKPGEIADFAIDLNLVRADKKPLAAWKHGDLWSYQLRFDVYNGDKWLSELGVRTLNRIVGVFETDYGPRIVDSNLPAQLVAGQTIDAEVVLKNTGVEPWDRKRTKIGYHWYHLDGTEMQWDGLASPIPATLQPGLPAIFSAKVKAPDYDGQYVLVWDVMIDNEWLSVGSLSRGGDILPVFVEVTGGKLAFADLSGVCDTVAMSLDTDRASADFDGGGASFPAELMPPDVGTSKDMRYLYPAGYNCDRRSRAEDRISFRLPDKAAGTKNAVKCAGQAVAVDPGSYVALHVLGASTYGDASGDLSLEYSGGAASAMLKMSNWGSPPAQGEGMGLMTGHRHGAGGDEIGRRAFLHHYTIPLDASKSLTAVTLPKNQDMKIVAITLERAAMPPASAEVKPAGE